MLPEQLCFCRQFQMGDLEHISCINELNGSVMIIKQSINQ